MKRLFSVCLVLALAAGLFAARTFAEETRQPAKSAEPSITGHLTPVSDKTDATWLAKARAAYPLDRCAVSGDKFDGGAMGKPQDYVFSQMGQADRLVRFCCKDCVKEFNEDPAKVLAQLDAAVAAKNQK